MTGPVEGPVPPSEPSKQDPPAHGPTGAAVRYDLKRIQQMLGLSRYTIRQLIDGGFVTPARGPGRALSFEFRDVVLMRVANELREARIPTRRIMRSLERLRAELPSTLPLSGLRIKAIGDQVAVHRRRQAWDAESGQLLIDLDFDLGAVPAPPTPALAPMGRLAPGPVPAGVDPLPSKARDRVASRTASVPATADDHYQQAVALEAREPGAAERHYRQALTLDPGHRDAVLNLSALLCERGRWHAAIRLLDESLPRLRDCGLLHFNRGVALEELGRGADAVASYEAALRVEPTLADAHYNLARLFEIAGDHRRALRHLSSYRRLTRG